LREETGDARGTTSSLHAIGKSWCGVGEHAKARDYLARAEHAAADLGELVLLSKVRHSEGASLIETGDLQLCPCLIKPWMGSASMGLHSTWLTVS
jgi:hypothetical protein